MCLTCYSYTASLNILYFTGLHPPRNRQTVVFYIIVFFLKIPFRAEFENSVCLCVFPQLFRFHPTVQVALS